MSTRNIIVDEVVIAQAMMKKRFNSADLARTAKVSCPCISRARNRKPICLDSLVKIADALDVDPKLLIANQE